jgi:predicted Zn finger-like uncharacterized protein
VYTQCPECQIAFRVTVEVLRKAGGRVRCGGCEHAFNALDYLSDGVPGTASNQSAPGNDPVSSEKPDDDFDSKSKALLETLDELAGPENVRIEDTGVEWRVLDENGRVESESQVPLALDTDDSADGTSAAAGQRRYDDDTELPDDFAEEEESPYVPQTPQRRATDVDEQQTEFDTHQVDLALEGDETWAQLIDEDDLQEEENVELEANDADSEDDLARQLEEAEARQIADDSALLPQLAESLIQEAEGNDGKIPFDVEVELAAIHSDVTAISTSANEESVPADLDSQFNLQAEALGLDITRNDELDEDATDSVEEDDIASKELDAEVIAAEESADKKLESELLADENDGEYIEDDDELSAEEEAAIVQKLRDSTGSFQKQIIAAQHALDNGENEEYREENDTEDEALQLQDENEDEEKPEPVADESKADEPEAGAGQEEEDVLSQLSADYAAEEPVDQSGSDEDDTAENDTLSRTMIQAGIDPSVLDNDNAETIIMEGEIFHRSAEDHAESTAENESLSGLDDQKSLVDTYMLNKGKESTKGRLADTNWGMVGGIAVLMVLLVAQYLHASRQTFATYGAFNQTIGPVYRALGNAVTPRWNIKGWQFERTSGSTDDNDEVLTVFSTVRNTSEDPLPYPLVHLSLTDRWEDIIGSKILEPADYLAGDMDPRTPVAPGDSFTAVIAVERPSTEATGFQLYVCYRVSTDRVRCATEDFKE